MNKLSPGASPAFTYAYIAAFFVLLTGIFHPLITGTGLAAAAVGVLALFAGLAGGILLWRAASPGPGRPALLGGGFALMAASLYVIFQLTGRA